MYRWLVSIEYAIDSLYRLRNKSFTSSFRSLVDLMAEAQGVFEMIGMVNLFPYNICILKPRINRGWVK